MSDYTFLNADANLDDPANWDPEEGLEPQPDDTLTFNAVTVGPLVGAVTVDEVDVNSPSLVLNGAITAPLGFFVNQGASLTLNDSLSAAYGLVVSTGATFILNAGMATIDTSGETLDGTFQQNNGTNTCASLGVGGSYKMYNGTISASQTESIGAAGVFTQSAIATNTATAIVPAGFNVIKSGDFNGDGVADVMIYNSTSGNAEVGLVAGGHISSWSAFGSANPATSRLLE
jgi:hypothetical protein